MATTRLMPLHTGKGRTVAEALGRTTDYVKNPEKTDGGELVSAYQCNPAIVDQEFLFSKRQYAAMTGRNQKEHDVIAYHLRQSFKPGEITPELANKIGYELAMSLTKGKHAFIVCTHVDKEHIHSHIVFNSTSLDCSRKFNNFWGSSFAVRKISDLLCLENGLSVIENPKLSRGSYGNWLGEKPPTVREQLERMIDATLTGCKDFDSFLAALKTAGVEVKRGKHLAFKIPGGKKFIRCSSLGEDYTEAAILERISGKRVITPVQKQVAPNLLIDIQAKLQQAHSLGFERWASVFNLKVMAKPLSFFHEDDLLAYADFEAACDAAAQKYHDLADRTKANSARMEEISALQRHIGTYSKTREIYAQYRRLPPKKQEEFYAQHASAIISCEAAKRYFDSLGLKKLPSIQSLKQEYAALSAENRKLYPDQKKAKAEMMELLTARHNTERILSLSEEEKRQKQRQEER